MAPGRLRPTATSWPIRCSINFTAGDYSLPKTSPCIDAGSNASWMTGAKDLAGNDRIQKGTTDLIVDMGAYETYVAPAGTVFMFR